MNSIERIVAAVSFEPLDRVPVMPLVFGHAARLAGVPLKEYVSDGELLARCQIESRERYGYDAVFAFMDAAVECEALGARVKFHDDLYPAVENHLITAETDERDLTVPDPRTAGRMPELLKAAARLRGEVGDRALVLGLVLGPMTLATQLMGLEALLFLSVDDRPRFDRLLDFCTETITCFGLAQIEAGAHLPILFEPAACPEMLPAATFTEAIQPRLKSAFDAFMAAGAAANLLHIAGKTRPFLPLYAEMGVHIAGFDYPVSAAKAQQALPKTCLLGNVRPFAFAAAQPQEIYNEAARLIADFAGRGGFILSGGCELPLETRPENLEALVAAARERPTRSLAA